MNSMAQYSVNFRTPTSFFGKCDVLASWNCKHIANANKTDHIRRVNAKLGYETPQLTTPLELLGEEP